MSQLPTNLLCRIRFGEDGLGMPTVGGGNSNMFVVGLVRESCYVIETSSASSLRAGKDKR